MCCWAHLSQILADATQKNDCLLHVKGQRSLSSLTVDRLIDSFRELQMGTSSSETDRDHVTIIIIFSPPTHPLQKVI